MKEFLLFFAKKQNDTENVTSKKPFPFMFDAASKPIRERNDWAPNKMMTQLDQFNMNLVGQVEWLPISKYRITSPSLLLRPGVLVPLLFALVTVVVVTTPLLLGVLLPILMVVINVLPLRF